MKILKTIGQLVGFIAFSIIGIKITNAILDIGWIGYLVIFPIPIFIAGAIILGGLGELSSRVKKIGKPKT